MIDYKELAQIIYDKGYSMAFGITGSGPSYQLIKAIGDLGISYITVSNESAAAVAAGTYAYRFNKKALAISIKGPGFVNLLSGVAACFLEGFNVLVISEEYGEASNIKARHKRLDQQIMLSEVAIKKSSLVSKNLNRFMEDCPYRYGPKYFSLSDKIFPECHDFPLPNEMNHSHFFELIERIRIAEKPLLILGSLCYRMEWLSHLEDIKVPILTTVQAKGAIDERSSNAFGVYTGVGMSQVPENELIHSSDLVVTLGLRNDEILGIQDKHAFLNLDLFVPPYDEETQVCSIEQLLSVVEELKLKLNWAQGLKDKYELKLREIVESPTWLPAKIFSEINNVEIPSTIVLDTGFFCTIGEHIFLAGPKKRFIGSSNGRNMGLSVPMALGIAISHEPTFCCFGDGGIRYHLGDVRTIAEKKLPVFFILFSDGQYGSVSAYIGTAVWEPHLTKPEGTSWSKIFEAMGIQCKVAKSMDELGSVILDWDGKTPYFLEAVFNKDQYSTMTTNIRK